MKTSPKFPASCKQNVEKRRSLTLRENGLFSVPAESMHVLQSQRTWDEANLTAFFHQPSYPPIIVVFLEHRNKDAINSLIFPFILFRGQKIEALCYIILYICPYYMQILLIVYYTILYISVWGGAVQRIKHKLSSQAKVINT